jgi:hypothetical protein
MERKSGINLALISEDFAMKCDTEESADDPIIVKEAMRSSARED